MGNPESPTVQLVSGIHCETYGTEGDWIVFVQGLGGHSSFWQEAVKEFSGTSRVVTHDHAGIGRSSQIEGRRSIAEMSADVAKVLDAVGVRSAHIVGHSMGGLVAQEFALEYPHRVKSLAIGASFSKTSNYLRLLLEFRREILRKLGPAAYCRFQTLSATPYELFEHQLDFVLERERRSLKATENGRIVDDRIGAILDFDREKSLGSLQFPTLILAARDDAFVPWQDSKRLADQIRGAKFELLERGGHFFPQNASSAYLKVLSGFLHSIS